MTRPFGPRICFFRSKMTFRSGCFQQDLLLNNRGGFNSGYSVYGLVFRRRIPRYPGIPWYSKVFHGIPAVFLGIPGLPRVFQGLPGPVVFRSIPWYSVVFRSIPGYSRVFLVARSNKVIESTRHARGAPTATTHPHPPSDARQTARTRDENNNISSQREA